MLAPTLLNYVPSGDAGQIQEGADTGAAALTAALACTACIAVPRQRHAGG